MASTSGPAKDQEGPVHGPQESTSSAAAAAAADASIPAPPEGAGDVSPPSPPPPPPPSSVQSRAHERAREQPGDGGRGADRSSSAAAAVDRKGKKKIGEDSSSPAPPDDREQAPRKEGRKKSDSPMKFLRSSILAIHGYAKKKKVPIDKAFIHYFGNIHNALQHGYVPLHLAHLDTRYSELRPVRRDGEGFYRSFMFSYLEQVADRVDTREEDRLLDAVRKLATRAEHLQWASEFSRRCEAFETLIEKIKKLKCMSEQPTSAIRGELLLELFSSYDTTDDIFAFLRLAAAIWICTHKGLYGQRVTGLGEGVSLEDWCSTQVIPPRVHADHVTMSALSRALGVAVRVEDTLDGRKKDLMAAELQSITRASNPRFRGIEDMYCVARGTPRVTLVRILSDNNKEEEEGASILLLLQFRLQVEGLAREMQIVPRVQVKGQRVRAGSTAADVVVPRRSSLELMELVVVIAAAAARFDSFHEVLFLPPGLIVPDELTSCIPSG
ncbi:Os02g0517600 [Oryza sativa Japonica Group]|uniref:Os02g0517600 protein n=1 Tax=Oryza sativa subsp. japonica TaxID=39947 RepID=C7IYS6_ORYSJ|nr:Os02g0517600 [Oryza sativa Japonica Group]|eukprot:NP_001172989.1 Os02g0517600 [Oryza sativa Japonica Group]